MVGTSCIEQKNLYQGDDNDGGTNGGGANKGKDVACAPDFFYPFDKEARNIKAEITIHTNNILPDEERLKAEIPALKYNKSWLCMLTQDDCKQVAFSYTWAAIHGKPLSKQHYYTLAQLNAGDLPPDVYYLGKALGTTDGAGNEVRFSFVTTLSPEWDFMNTKSNVNKGFRDNSYRFTMKSGLTWGSVKEMLNYGVGISFHDVKTEDVNNKQTILRHYGIAQTKILDELSGRGCKMLAEPNGNRMYANAALSYDPIQTMTAEKNAVKLYPHQRNLDLSKVIIERSFYNPNSLIGENRIDIIKEAIKDELRKPEEQRAAICIGVHGADDSWVKFLLWLNDEYGKDGEDNMWMPNQEEYYEYTYYRNESVLEIKRIDHHTLKLVVDLPSQKYFYYPSISINLSDILLDDINLIESNEDVTGLSYAEWNDGIMINVDCRKYLADHAENFVKRYEADPTGLSNAEDAHYFVNMLKESDKKNELKRRIQ